MSIQTIRNIPCQLLKLTRFIACGFEHCAGNMWLIPMGLVLKGNKVVLAAAAEKVHGGMLDLTQLTWKEFFVNNLFPVTLGNIIGGVFLIGVIFWFIYLRPHSGYLSPEVKLGFPQDK